MRLQQSRTIRSQWATATVLLSAWMACGSGSSHIGHGPKEPTRTVCSPFVHGKTEKGCPCKQDPGEAVRDRSGARGRDAIRQAEGARNPSMT